MRSDGKGSRREGEEEEEREQNYILLLNQNCNHNLNNNNNNNNRYQYHYNNINNNNNQKLSMYRIKWIAVVKITTGALRQHLPLLAAIIDSNIFISYRVSIGFLSFPFPSSCFQLLFYNSNIIFTLLLCLLFVVGCCCCFLLLLLKLYFIKMVLALFCVCLFVCVFLVSSFFFLGLNESEIWSRWETDIDVLVELKAANKDTVADTFPHHQI